MTDNAKTNPTPRPSGPLWVDVDGEGNMNPYAVLRNSPRAAALPSFVSCRLIPGHGRVVPVELVEAIAKECARIDPDGYHGRLVDLVEAALGGAM